MAPLVDRRATPKLAPRIIMLGLSAAGVAWANTLADEAGSLRALLLVYVSMLFFARFALMLLVLVPRPVAWWEALCTGFGMAILPPLFVVAGARSSPDADHALGLYDLPALALYSIGSLLTSVSEWQRWRWKKLPANLGKLYVGGLFGIAQHINYFGEVLTFAGWALLTLNLIALLVPLGFALALRKAYAPDLDRYIAKRYGKDPSFELWKRLPCLVPGGGGPERGSPWTDLLTLGIAALGAMALARCVLAASAGLLPSGLLPLDGELRDEPSRPATRVTSNDASRASRDTATQGAAGGGAMIDLSDVPPVMQVSVAMNAVLLTWQLSGGTMMWRAAVLLLWFALLSLYLPTLIAASLAANIVLFIGLSSGSAGDNANVSANGNANGNLASHGVGHPTRSSSNVNGHVASSSSATPHTTPMMGLANTTAAIAPGPIARVLCCLPPPPPNVARAMLTPEKLSALDAEEKRLRESRLARRAAANREDSTSRFARAGSSAPPPPQRRSR